MKLSFLRIGIDLTKKRRPNIVTPPTVWDSSCKRRYYIISSCSLSWYDMIRCDTIYDIYDIPNVMIWFVYDMIWLIWCDTTWYDMIDIWYMLWYDIYDMYDMIPYGTIYDMIYMIYDMIWCDMIWYGMIYDMIYTHCAFCWLSVLNKLSTIRGMNNMKKISALRVVSFEMLFNDVVSFQSLGTQQSVVLFFPWYFSVYWTRFVSIRLLFISFYWLVICLFVLYWLE